MKEGQQVLHPSIANGTDHPHVGPGGVHELMVHNPVQLLLLTKQGRPRVDPGCGAVAIHGAEVLSTGRTAGYIIEESIAEAAPDTLTQAAVCNLLLLNIDVLPSCCILQLFHNAACRLECSPVHKMLLAPLPGALSCHTHLVDSKEGSKVTTSPSCSHDLLVCFIGKLALFLPCWPHKNTLHRQHCHNWSRHIDAVQLL